jgi:bacteriocin biosynthesis cyclodehydratase domain-containing protein
VHLLLHRDRALTQAPVDDEVRPAAGAVPELPLLAPWYRIVEEGARMVLEHGDRAVVLEGAAVRRLLPHLLPLLDGTRTAAEVAAVLGPEAAPAVESALALLGSRGLLTQGPGLDRAAVTAVTAHELAAGSAVSPRVAANRLETARVGVAGDSRVAVETARLLARAGVGAIVPRRLDEPGDDDLLVAAPAPEEVAARLGRCNELALEEARPWLQVLPFDGRMAAVGPLFLPGETACHGCYRLRRSASLAFGDLDRLLEPEPVRAPAGPALEAVVAGLAATVALRWVVLRDPRVPGVLHAVEPDALQVTRHAVLRVPRCPACSGADRLAPPAPWFDPPVEVPA